MQSWIMVLRGANEAFSSHKKNNNDTAMPSSFPLPAKSGGATCLLTATAGRHGCCALHVHALSQPPAQKSKTPNKNQLVMSAAVLNGGIVHPYIRWWPKFLGILLFWTLFVGWIKYFWPNCSPGKSTSTSKKMLSEPVRTSLALVGFRFYTLSCSPKKFSSPCFMSLLSLILFYFMFFTPSVLDWCNLSRE